MGMSKKSSGRVLITGGSGFLGSHLCDHFIKKGWKVVCLDNFITGTNRNVGHLFKNKNFSFLKRDISKHTEIPGALDAVLHFASPASPPDYLRHPIQTLKVGALGTHNALGIAKKKKARFLMASTSEVYGDPLVHPQKETYWGNVNPIGPRGVYDEAKRFAEAITLAYHRQHGVDTKIVRIFNTYGRRMRPEDGRVIPNFITQALLEKPITVYGDGSQTRSYCYVDDLVRGIDKLIFSKLNVPVNIGNPNEMSVLKLAKVIIELTGSKSKIVHRPLPVDDPKQRCPDISRAKKELHWKPEVDLREGLAETICYFKEEVLGRRA
jgi:dTDP-glucose 4,6-dehydratase